MMAHEDSEQSPLLQGVQDEDSREVRAAPFLSSYLKVRSLISHRLSNSPKRMRKTLETGQGGGKW